MPLDQVKTGVGHYTWELARHLAPLAPSDDFDLISPLADAQGAAIEEREFVNLRRVRVPVNRLTRHWWSLGLPRYLAKHPLDVFHGTNFDVPVWGDCPSVLTIHDLSLLLHPETHLRRQVSRGRRRLPVMVRRATTIITPTDSVRREVCARFAVPEEKVCVVPEAPRRTFKPLAAADVLPTLGRLGVEDDFFLFVGTIEPRKNLITLIKAFEEVFRATSHRPQLVIAGKIGWGTEPFLDYLRATPVKDRVLLAGYLSDLELGALYSACRAFIYPSIYEGFGLPPLEAMASGAPVITSDIPAIKEVVGGAARLFPPRDAGSLARAIVETYADEKMRGHYRRVGAERAADFSWEKTASLTYLVYETTLRLARKRADLEKRSAP